MVDKDYKGTGTQNLALTADILKVFFYCIVAAKISRHDITNICPVIHRNTQLNYKVDPGMNPLPKSMHSVMF